jgi:glycosyltransferase domain-containing protein
MQQLNDITIYIPTINRPHFLDRCLNFLNSYNTKLNICIFDSSNFTNRIINKGLFIKYSNLNIVYIPEEEIDFEFKNMGQMCLYVLNNFIKTKYVTFTGDDDFLFVHNLISQMNFLEKNNDYIMCHGNIIMFKEHNNKLEYQGNSCSVDLPQDNPLDRFIWYGFNASTLQYGVIKTKDFIRVHQFSNKIENRWLASEFLPNILMSIYGKIKNLGTITCLQQWNHQLISLKNEMPEFDNWLFKIINFDESWKDFKIVSEIFYREMKDNYNVEDKEIYSSFENIFLYRVLHVYSSTFNIWLKNRDIIKNEYTKHHTYFSDIGKSKMREIDINYIKKVNNGFNNNNSDV